MPSRGARAFSAAVGEQKCSSSTTVSVTGLVRSTPPGVAARVPATLGGCASHNFLIAIKPVESDWDYIAEVTGDKSWSSANMTQYWERVERNAYGPFMVPGPEHGYNGWLGTQVFDPNYILTHDPLLVKNLLAAALQFPSPSDRP